ncbi:MAG: DUF4258 domain-containing protein, partial [Archaeoglobi archaeon]|nr:DUF4258 domain-containing protein [Archaeoglobi archaeon]
MIEFTPHARERMEKRSVTEDEVRDALENPDELLYDTKTGNFIAVKEQESRYLIIVYVPMEVYRIVSVVVTTKLNIIENRIRKGRWVR